MPVYIKVNKKILNANHLRTQIRKALHEGGRHLVAVAREKVFDKSTKTGHIYKIRRGKKTRNHQASAPGQYPANIRGYTSPDSLISGYSFVVIGSHRLVFGNRAEHAKPLEEGTARILPRPHIEPTIKSEVNIIKRYILQSIANVKL